MEQFLVLMGEIMLIICIESFLEVFIDERKNKYMRKIIDIGCYCGGLYLVLNFAYSYLLKAIFDIMRFYF